MLFPREQILLCCPGLQKAGVGGGRKSSQAYRVIGGMQRLYSAKEDGSCQHQHPCPAQEVSAHCWCAQFCCLLFQLALIVRFLCCPIRCLASVYYPVALCWAFCPPFAHLLRGLLLWSCIVLFLVIVCIFTKLRRGVVLFIFMETWAMGFESLNLYLGSWLVD